MSGSIQNTILLEGGTLVVLGDLYPWTRFLPLSLQSPVSGLHSQMDRVHKSLRRGSCADGGVLQFIKSLPTAFSEGAAREGAAGSSRQPALASILNC